MHECVCVGGGGCKREGVCMCDGFTCKIYIVQMRKANGNSRRGGRGKASHVEKGKRQQGREDR